MEDKKAIIIEIIKNISDESILNYIYDFISKFTNGHK